MPVVHLITKTKLVSELNTTTSAAGVTGYTAQNSGTVNYSGSLNLNGANSVAVQTLNNGTANLNNATVKANGDALRANAGNNTINVNGGTVTGTTNVFNSVAGTNSLVATNGRGVEWCYGRWQQVLLPWSWLTVPLGTIPAIPL